MIAALSLAFASHFTSDLDAPAPYETYAQLRQQATFGSTSLAFTTLDVGLARDLPNNTYVGGTAHVGTAGIFGGDANHLQMQSFGAAFWAGTEGEHTQSRLAIAASMPPRQRRVFGLMEQEAGWKIGLRNQFRYTIDPLEVLVATELNANAITLCGASIGTMLTVPMASRRVGLQVGGKIGISRLAWLSTGAKWRPNDSLTIGTSVLTGIALVSGGPAVHLSPMLSVYYRVPTGR